MNNFCTALRNPSDWILTSKLVINATDCHWLTSGVSSDYCWRGTLAYSRGRKYQIAATWLSLRVGDVVRILWSQNESGTIWRNDMLLEGACHKHLSCLNLLSIMVVFAIGIMCVQTVATLRCSSNILLMQASISPIFRSMCAVTQA